MNVTLQILASTASEGTLADGEKAFMQGEPSVREEPWTAKFTGLSVVRLGGHGPSPNRKRKGTR